MSHIKAKLILIEVNACAPKKDVWKKNGEEKTIIAAHRMMLLRIATAPLFYSLSLSFSYLRGEKMRSPDERCVRFWIEECKMLLMALHCTWHKRFFYFSTIWQTFKHFRSLFARWTIDLSTVHFIAFETIMLHTLNVKYMLMNGYVQNQ